MAQQTINVGAAPNDGTGTPLRTAFQYTNSNFTELYTALGGGSGLPGASGQLIFNNGTSLAGDNELFYNATTNTLTTEKLIVPGNTQVAGSLSNLYVGSIMNPTLFANTNTKQVGIGTASPTEALHINRSSGAGVFIRLQDNANTNYIGTDSGNFRVINNASQDLLNIQQLGVFTFGDGAGGTRMTLNSTGLGLGQTPISNAGIIQVGRTNNTGFSDIGTYGFSFAESFQWVIGPSTQSNNSGAGKMWRMRVDKPASSAIGSSFTLATYTGFDASVPGNYVPSSGWLDRLIIDNSGNVGIGVVPSAITAGQGLEVGAVGNGLWCNNSTFNQLIQNAYFSSASATGWKYAAAASTQAVRVQLGSGEFNVFNAPAGTAGTDLTWTQRLTLDASGNLLVGVTTTGNRLDVQKSTDCTVLVKSTGANANVALDYVSTYGNHTIRKNGTAVWDFGVINDASATPAFKVSNASSVGVQLVSGATSWTTLSDETMKDIIEPISNAVAKVGSLRSVIGKFKTDDSNKRRSFLIAQDVQSVLPEAVDVIGENNELGLRYTEVIPLLVAAIKELTAEVNALKNA